MLTPPSGHATVAGAEAAGARRWDELKPALALWGLLLCTNGVFGLLYQFTDSSSPWLGLLMALVDAIIIVVYCSRDRARLAPLLSIRGVWSLRSLAAAPVFVGLVAFLALYFEAFRWLGFGTVPYIEPFQEHGWPLWAAFALVSFAPGVFEELAFRGQILLRIEHVVKPSDALIVQAAMFSVLHMQPSIFVSHFVVGLALGWLRRYTRNLYPGMLVHMAWNALVLWGELAP